MKKPSINKKNKMIYISTIVGLLIVAIVLALSAGTNAQDFWAWSTQGTGSVMWVFILLIALWGGLYALWSKIKER